MLALALLAQLAAIDLAPARYESHSPDGRFVAVVDPATYTTSVHDVTNGQRNLRWSMAGWHRALHLANDGEHVAIPADDLGFVRVDYDPAVEVLRIQRRDRVVRVVTLREVAHPRDMIRVSSFYWWGTFRGLERDGKSLRVETASRDLVFDLATGRIR